MMATAMTGTLADVVARLRMMEQDLLRERDRRAVFVTAYLEMSRRLLASLLSFRDPRWVERYAVAFASHYFAAFDAYESPRPDLAPRPWRVAFTYSKARRVLVLQDLLLGINAHIGYDLPRALVEVGTSFDDPLRRQDHVAVNRVLLAAIGPIQKRIAILYSPALGRLDRAFGRLDECLTAAAFWWTRGTAWRKGRWLWGAIGRLEVEDRDELIEDAAACAGHLLAVPARLRGVRRAKSRIESDSRWMGLYRGL